MEDFYSMVKAKLLDLDARSDQEKDAATKDAKERSERARERKKQQLKATQHRWYERNKKKVARQGRERRNSVHGRKVLEKWKEDNKQRISQKHREYYKNHQEEIIVHNKKYREENAEIIREKRRVKYKADPEKYKARSRAYYTAHAEEQREKARERHAKRKAELERLRTGQDEVKDPAGIQAQAHRRPQACKQKVRSNSQTKRVA